MKFLAVPAAFAVAFAQKKGAAPAAPLTTYTCPAGYSLEGTSCSKTETAAYITSSIPNTEVVPASSFCPKGSTMSGGACTKTETAAYISSSIPRTENVPASSFCPKGSTMSGGACTKTTSVAYTTSSISNSESVAPTSFCPSGSSMSGGACTQTTTTARIASTTSTQIPMTSCPAGTTPAADGMCTTMRTIRVPQVSPRSVPVTTTTVEKAPFSVPVSKQVSVPGAPTCPSGSSMEGGACIVTGSSTEYSTQSIQTSVNVPVSTPVSSSACPSGTTAAADGSCTARLSFQSVEQSSSEKSVRFPTLSSKPASFSLPATTLRTGSTCPQGTSAQADGTCTVTLRTSSLESYEVPVSSEVAVITQVPQTLTLTKQHLVPSYSCPAGSTASGFGPSMTCTVTLPSASPVSSSAPRTVKQARFEKRPVTVTLSRVESTPMYYCPTGTVENSMGECTATVTIRTPYTVSETHTACPAGSTEYPSAAPGSSASYSGKGAAPSCKRAATARVPATLIPGTSKGAAKYACPEGTTPIGEGASMSCAAPTYEEIPMETFTTSSIAYETSTVTETVPKLYRYETRTVTETATTEEVYTVYDDIVLEETSVSLSTSSYTETVPALVSYSVASDSETVTVSNDRISYVSCSDAMAGNFGPGASLAPGVSASCLTETKFRVVSNSYTEAVPAVATYFTEEVVETTSVEETFQTYETSSMTETSHSVSTAYNMESVGPNTLVEYSTSYTPETVTETNILSTPVPMTETVSTIPTYDTETVMETAHSERVSTVAQKSTMTVQEMSYSSDTITESVVPVTTYRTETSTSYSCPAGTTDTGSACVSTITLPMESSCPAGTTASGAGCTRTTFAQVQSCPAGYTDTGSACVSTVSVPMESSCPAGTTASGAGCTRTTFTQVQSCPAGYTDTGSACVTFATVPATPVTMAAPAPSKYSAPTKHSRRRHGHKHD
uniref:Uncharacterized protein n=1 Tax=Chromera velia CCMP2878 TaxID=1169474 RepID=A0A0G4HAQ9_9ALVE|eukprot:Cvel_25597.t1-p1 / transcript=Cvel_25597.t1 / gene=Cvel_25597 / organism=Chromera_velia_CCMP2878 / gene_product=Cell wall protein DAN4, putative / transcript_product=Cell wall protein DAN4, putative / location=Cvel_scaffold2921:7136-10530(+) / protein_length=953 / sequence_SO=supercontig / SO=protein_coding / is_pseudo=false